MRNCCANNAGVPLFGAQPLGRRARLRPLCAGVALLFFSVRQVNEYHEERHIHERRADYI